MQLRDIIKVLEDISPKLIAEKWDNTGLILGEPESEVKKILITLDIDQQVLKRSIKENINLVISHHPLIFNGLKNIRANEYIGGLIIGFIKNNISVFAYHTNFDNANGGLNDYLTRKLRLKNIGPLRPYKDIYKLVTFIPKKFVDRLRGELSKVGAGCIGNYSSCSFNIEGIGTFKGGENTNPTIGIPGRLEYVDEIRIEMVVPGWCKSDVISTLKRVHPYEEPAYEFYPIEAETTIVGQGRIGDLESTMTLQEFVKYIKSRLNLSTVRVGGKKNVKIKRVGICSGAGSDLIKEAEFKNCDVFISGDISYHNFFNSKICIIDTGHYGTEKFFPNALYSILKQRLKDVKLIIYRSKLPYTEY